MSTDGYRKLKLRGPVNVLPQTEIVRPEKGGMEVLILIGPIGSGKSSFIQSFAQKGPSDAGGSGLQIAKDQLEGVTREIGIYEVVNVTPKVYIVDTPGSADENISELGVVGMLGKLFATQLRSWRVPTHLYFHPINNVRVNRTLQRGLVTFQAGFMNQVGWKKNRKLALITTMWDQLFTPEQMARAESRLVALQEQYWKKFKTSGSSIYKFENTQDSALRILDGILYSQSQCFFVSAILIVPTAHIQQGQLLHDSLLQRIESVRQQLLFIDQELAHCDSELGLAGENGAHNSLNAGGSTINVELESGGAGCGTTDELKDILEARRHDLTANLERYEKEMADFHAFTAQRWLVVKWVQKYILK